ncbi:hypothetical protein P3T73_07095 [Kiritimatiellota bacterium B12222]|nr:hypothetical protein P3T73_07095 [Kiritimatiellota bacterium B12222]
MRVLLYCLSMLMISPVLFSAGKDAPVKRRPRIRVYDQEAAIVPVATPEIIQKAETEDLERQIKKDISAPTGFQNPIDGLSFISPLSNTWSSPVAEEEEDEDEGWVTPEDFLLKEDLLQKDPELDVEDAAEDNGEMEITDWKALQKTMIEEALKKEAPELSDEEMEELFAQDEVSEEEATSQRELGMEVQELAPVQDLQSSSPLEGRLGGLDSNATAGQFVPILQSGSLERVERAPRMELTGSRNLLNGIRDKWSSNTDTGSIGSAATFDRPELPTESLMPRSSSGLSSGSLLSNPAVSVAPSSGMPASLPSLQSQPVLSAPRPAPVESSAMPAKEYRVRSRIGVAPGF